MADEEVAAKEKPKKIEVADLDEAAWLLLQASKDEKALPERVKAFVAATDWVKLKKELFPPRREPSKGERIKQRLNGGAPQRSGAPGRREADEVDPDLDA